MTMHERMIAKIKEALVPVYLDVENESSKHNVAPGSETHFKVVVVSDQFENKSLVERHRLVNDALRDEFRDGLHALSLQTLAPSQWTGATSFASPKCMGG